LALTPRLRCDRPGFIEETKRFYLTLELRLKGRDWLAGTGRGKCSLADIKAAPWFVAHALFSRTNENDYMMPELLQGAHSRLFDDLRVT
jgi:hypothetical protein